MKSILRSNFLTVLLAGLMLFLIADIASAADFTLRVPPRGGMGPPPQIARAKITLRMMNATVVGTDKVEILDMPGGSVIGSRTLTNSIVGNATLPNGDKVKYYTLPSAPKDAVIEITFFSKFSSAGNFCNVVDINQYPFNVTFRVNPAGGNSIQSSRLSSYTVPSKLTADQCGCPSRRVETPSANWNAPGSPPPGTFLGRHAYDVVLILDRSGSMGDPIPSNLMGSDSAIKMNALKEAVKTFIDVWGAEMNAPEDDRLLIVWFESGVTVTPASENFVRRDDVGPNPTWADLESAVNTQTTASSTAMGDGITKAVDLLQTKSTGNDAAIVLLTNGMENDGLHQTQTDVDPNHTREFFNTLQGIYIPVGRPCITMECIGVGAPGDTTTDTLMAIATQTGASAYQPVNSVAMANSFGNSLVDILRGNTMSILTRTDGTLAAGTPQVSPPTTFKLDSSVQQAIVVLGWSGSTNQNALKLQLFPPGSSSAVFAKQVKEPLYTIQTLELPASGPVGDWHAQISRDVGNANVPYYLSVYTVEGKFDSRVDFKKLNYGTGDDIILTAQLGFGGQPLLSQGNGLEVRVERPVSAINTLLHNLNVAPSVLTTQPAGVSSDSYTKPYERKFFNLLQTTTFGQDIEPRPDPQLFRLLDDGDPAHGDDKAGDGIYSMRYTQTKLPGRYRFKLTMNLTTPTGAITRIEQHDTEVNVNDIDSQQSEVNATRDLITPGNYRLDIVPADRFGNFLGPGYADQIKVTLVGGGSVSGPVIDERQNGTYTVQLTGVPSAATHVKVSYGSDEFADIPLKVAQMAKRRYAFFAGLGGNFPHGDFNTSFNSGVSAQFGLEYLFTNRVSVEGSFGFDRFQSALVSDHLNLFRGSGNIKLYPVIGTFQFGIFGGGGVYHFDPGDTHGGLNIGAVGEFRLNTSVSLESTYNFHTVFTSGSNTRFSTLQGGIRFRF